MSDVARISGSGERIAEYAISDREMAAGSTLGGPKACMVLKATGAIEKFYSIDSGTVFFETLVLHHWDEVTGIGLAAKPGNFEIHPDRQEHMFELTNGVAVHETLFVLSGEPSADEVDPPAGYYAVVLTNTSKDEVKIGTYAFCQVRGETEHDVEVQYDAECKGLVAWNRSKPGDARIFACSKEPASYEATLDHGKSISDRWPGKLSGRTANTSSDPLGIIHLSHELKPGDRVEFYYTLTFSSEGRGGAKRVLGRCLSASEALARTSAYYAKMLSRSIVMTPDSTVNRGVLWAKANMLRIMLKAPTGWCFVNDPTRSNNSVGRDTAWFGFGCDYLWPQFVKESLRAYVKRQEKSGMIVEYYDIRNGKSEDYGLNINDNTPLLILALWHHFNASGDRDFLAEVYPAVAKAARYILSQRNEQGLVWCTSDRTSDWGIIGWRNVIKDYRLSGATTEVNSECYAALQTVSHIARVLDKDDESKEFLGHAEALRTAINTHLKNSDNGLYYLNIDLDGAPRSDITSDLVFPVMFGVAEPETAARIVSRLSGEDFWTEAGIRTVPRDAPNYGATHGYGLLGGVWVGVTFWYAFAAARFNSEFMAYALSASFRHYSRDPKKNNTVPGQFSEWLHGETLANQGMMLSPWFPPRYLWAAIEGAAGLDVSRGTPSASPRLAPDWKWLGVRNLPYAGRNLTWFVARCPQQRLYTNFQFHQTTPYIAYDEDISERLHASGDSAAAIGLRKGEDLVLFAGNTTDRTVATALALKDKISGTYGVRTFNSLRGEWVDDGVLRAGDIQRGIPLQLERKGFTVLELQQEV